MIAELLAAPFRSDRGPRFRNATLENPAVGLQDPAAIEQLGGTMAAASGALVDHTTAISLPAVRQAVRLISCDIAKMKLAPYRRKADDDNEKLTKHRAYRATAKRANPWKSARRFWQDFYTHCLLWENGYAYITLNSAGQFELYNLLPDRTAPDWCEGELIFVTEVGGEIKTLWPEQVLHVAGLSLDGTKGADLVSNARDTIGLSLARRNFESKFFKNGARIGGTLVLPLGTTKTAKDTLEEGFIKAYESGDNPFKTIIARDGVKFEKGQFSIEETQMVDGREADKRDIASFFELPPSKLGISESKSYNSYEQDNLSYLQGCLHHWSDAGSDECDMKLLTEDEFLNQECFFEHDYSEFITADFTSTCDGLVKLKEAEIINPNEARTKLRWNRRKDPDGDKYENSSTKSAAATAAASGGKPPAATPPKKPKAAQQKLVEDVVGRMVRRTGVQARKLSGNADEFLKWIDGGADEQREAFDAAVLPVLQALGEDDAITSLSSIAFTDGFLAQIDGLRKLTEPPHVAADLKANVEKFLNQFERTAPESVAALIMEAINGTAQVHA